MKILDAFHDYLFSHSNSRPATVKNYISDVKRFITWYEARFHKDFIPTDISGHVIAQFIVDLTTPKALESSPANVAVSSIERYKSSLRKFFSYLVLVEAMSTNPFDMLLEAKRGSVKKDQWQRQSFKEYLYRSKSSPATIKNYIIDLDQFISWMTQSSSENDHYDIKKSDIFNLITPPVLDEYKRRLVLEAKAAPNTVNRKLSSLRKYIIWAQAEGILKNFKSELMPTNVSSTARAQGESQEILEVKQDAIQQTTELTDTVEPIEEALPLVQENPLLFPKTKEYSKFPPLRLLQKLNRFGVTALDTVLILPLMVISDKVLYGIWKAKGSPVFVPIDQPSVSNRLKQMLVRRGIMTPVIKRKASLTKSLPKSFYAPLAISLKHAPLHKKALFHIRHTRPQWYHTYHSYAIVHYLHAAILVVCMSAAGFGVVQAMSDTSPRSVSFASLPDGPPRLLAFKGKLTNADASPITANTNLRFGIYNDATASGSSQLWQELREVVPNPDGTFSLTLGEKKAISQHLFSDNARLYIGMTVGNDAELTPRKQIPTEVLAATADTVQGLRPITDPQSGQKNAILVLDSSGNMVISGNANPTFVATGGNFTLSGQTTLLTTTAGSNGDIRFIPDGSGKIDVQRPIHNTSQGINAAGITGAVEVDDTLAISASQSGQSALYINQNSTGPLISASQSGIAKFTVDSNGAATFGDSIMLYGNSLSSTQTSFNLLTTNPINLAIGTSATSLSLGGTGGVATLNNSQTIISGNLNVNGTTGLTFGNAAAGINFSGQGAHLITASSGNLQLGAVTLSGNAGIGSNVSLVPTDPTSENNLGSASNPFDSLYVNSIISPSIQGILSQWQATNGALSPSQIGNSLMLGSTASQSAVWQVFASGTNAGTASSSGNLSFRGANTAINQLNGGSISFQTSEGGDSNLTPRLTITNSGNIGLGTTTPAYRLDIPNMANASGQGRANAWVTYSSSRFKENVTVITDPLEKIGRLQGVYYNWKESFGGGRDIGFIAEEVGKVLPELVEYEADGVNAKSLKYDRITALTIEGIKAQQDEITQLTSMVDAITFTDNRQFHIVKTDGTGFAVETAANEKVTRSAALDKGIIGTLSAGLVSAFETTTQKLQATNALFDFMRVAKVESEFIAVTDMTVSGKLKATNATILSLKTDVLQSSAEAPQLSLKIGNSDLVFYSMNGQEDHEVASIDNQGNATFAGVLAAKTATIEESVTTKKVVAQELQLTDEGLMSLAMNISRFLPSHSDSEDIAINTSTSNNQTNGPTPTASDSGSTDFTPPTSPADGEIITDYESLASDSANLTLGPDDTIAIGTPLPSGAGYVFPDISVAGMITISGNFLLGDDSIDVVGADLQIQPLRSGGVSFMAGLVSINPSGDLSVEGNANFAKNLTVKGTLATNILSPVDGQDLIVKLGNGSEPTDKALVVQNASGAAQLRIQETGDVTSEGNASFVSLLSKSLTIMRGTQADASPIKTVASSSAGTAIILPGQTQRTIVTPFVLTKSLVYITPTSDTQGYVPYIARQNPENAAQGSEGSFTIEISEPVTKPIKINWWIVN